jgi:hypothetical protein
MDEAEQFATDYLKQRNLRTERFSKEELRSGKTADFRVFKQAQLVAYCEAKHVQRDEWLDEKLRDAEPLELVGGSRPDPIFNRLTAHIHKAAQQFAAVNPNHDCPNILVFANSDKSCTFSGDLRGVLTGNFYAEDGTVHPIYANFSNGRIMYEKSTIDAYVWWDEWRNAPKPSIWFWHNSQYYASVSSLLGSDPSAHRKVS